jgi:7-cyano-7-deazaguanine reductase
MNPFASNLDRESTNQRSVFATLLQFYHTKTAAGYRLLFPSVRCRIKRSQQVTHGASNRNAMSSEASKDLEVFPNPELDRSYTITMECPEFTCLCPRTGQPDFATIHIRYRPDELCIELKSLKLYLWSYRNEGTFHEALVNKILDDLSGACSPRFMEVIGDFYVRGGIHTTVMASLGEEL